MASIFLLSRVQEPITEAQKAILEGALRASFRDRWRDVGLGCYLVAADNALVTKDIADRTRITGGEAGTYLITKMDPYYGYASKSTWEWMSAIKNADE